MRNMGGLRMNRALLLILLCGIIFMTCGCSKENIESQKEIYVPIIGDASWLNDDPAFHNGVNIAIEELNSKYLSRGFLFKSSIIDDKAKYEIGVAEATKLASDSKVTAVFNLQNFDVSKTTAGILGGGKKLTVFPYGAYDSLFTANNPYLFCGVPSFSDLGKAMAAYAIKKGYRRIAVYHNGKQSQEELVTAFELSLLNTGTKVIDYVPSIASSNEFSNIYTRWKALNVDCVVVSQYGLERAFEVLKMLRTMDGSIPVIGEPIFNRANALSDNKSIAEGLVVPSTLYVNDNDELKDFTALYSKKFSKEADIWAVQGYDMMKLVAETAVRLGTNDPVSIAQAIHKEQGFNGIQGRISFAAGGALKIDIKKLDMLVCKNGVFTK